jgi:hypothetical protein
MSNEIIKDDLVEDVEVEDEEIQEDSSVEEGYKMKKKAMKNEEEDMEDDDDEEEDEEEMEEAVKKFTAKDHAKGDKYGDQIEKDVKAVSKVPTVFLQYLHFHNMGVSGTKAHPAIPAIEKELKKRGESPVGDDEGMEMFEKKMYNEAAYDKDFDESKPFIAAGVKGMKSKPWKKKFKNMETFDKFMDSDAAGDVEIQKMYNENVEDIRVQKEDFEGDLQALVESEATLSEGFKDKASIIFEAVLNSKLKEKEEQLKEQYETMFNEEVEHVKNELAESVDNYLNYAVQGWLEDNKLQVENGLRNEIAENFINQLKEVFIENYIDVPESKVDVVDQLAEEVVELESKLDTTIQREIQLKEELNKFKKEAILREQSIGLAETEFEKLKSLAEDVEFVNEKSFLNKVEVIKETYFKQQKAAPQLEELNEESDVPVEVSSTIDSYLKAIKANKNFS